MSKFLESYQESKKVRDLIKQPTFRSKNISGTYYSYDNHDLTFKITHIKPHVRWASDIQVNIKVCGRMKGWGWDTDRDGMNNVKSTSSFRSAVSRNKTIRQHAEKEVKKYLRLFGVKPYNVEVGKITVVDSL